MTLSPERLAAIQEPYAPQALIPGLPGDSRRRILEDHEICYCNFVIVLLLLGYPSMWAEAAYLFPK